MKQGNKKYVIIIVAIIVIVIIYVLYKRNKNSQVAVNTNTGSNSGSGSNSGTPAKPFIPTNTKYVGTDSSKWIPKKEVLVAVAPLVNVYSSTGITSGNVDKSVANGGTIGVFEGMQGNFAKVSYNKISTFTGFPYAVTGYVLLGNKVGQAANVTNV